LRKAGREKRVLGDEPEIAVSVRVAADKQADSSLLTLRGAQIPFWPHTGDENNATEMHAVMVQFRQLANLGATVVVLHNSSEKTDSAKNYRGSLAFKQDLDVGYLVTNSTTDTLLGTLHLEAFKTRVRVDPEIFFKYGAGRFAVDRKQTPVAAASTLKDFLIDHPGITLSGESFDREESLLHG
jgi:hypothetical protein